MNETKGDKSRGTLEGFCISRSQTEHLKTENSTYDADDADDAFRYSHDIAYLCSAIVVPMSPLKRIRPDAVQQPRIFRAGRKYTSLLSTQTLYNPLPHRTIATSPFPSKPHIFRMGTFLIPRHNHRMFNIVRIYFECIQISERRTVSYCKCSFIH